MRFKVLSLDVPYFDCGPDGHMRPIAALRTIQEAGLRHAEEMGLSYTRDRGALLFMTRLHMVFEYPLPLWRESISIRTWVSRVQRVKAFRAYELYDAAGRICARALLDGVLVDASTRRPIRFDMGEHRPVETEATISMPEKIEPAEGMEFMGERRAEWYQTDRNGHVHNVRHAELALSALPEAYAERPIADWTINYMEELYPGQLIRLYAHTPEPDTAITEGRDEGGSAIFRSRIRFCAGRD
jgi:medium-chain acyl-[acyl-carrier-protein] hydrolase